jgi:diaminopimelate decarboxylase
MLPSITQDRLYSILAARYGTPLYVYEEAVIARQFRQLSEALHGRRHTICYAVKANPNLSILRLIHDLGGGFDIVSEGELRRVQAAGGEMSRVVFSGVGKRASEIQAALAGGIRLFNVESASELRLIEALARETGKRAPISFRINPDISFETHPYLATGVKSSKFGVPVKEALLLGELAVKSEWLDLIGVDCHIGSQINEIAPLKQGYEAVIELARHFRSCGASVRYLDLGGGLGVGYSGHYLPLDLKLFGGMLSELSLDDSFELIFEPGKFLVAEAGSLLSRVITIKENDGKRFVIVDAGMNDLIRPALYEAFHKIEKIGESGGELAEVVDIVGPVCESGCYLARARELPRLIEGDLIAIRDAGAYCFSMASSYNSRRLPAEVMVDESGEERLIRKRDEFSDLWRNEVLPES